MSAEKTKENIAVVGATGQIGYPLSKQLMANGHTLTAVSRGRTVTNEEKMKDLEACGAKVSICDHYEDVDRMTGIFKGCHTVVIATRMNTAVAGQIGVPLIEAALQAGVSRYVPDEFGTHTLALEYGCGTLFDVKKDIQQRVVDSGMDWTLLFTGGFFDYFLPNLRLFDKITTFGDTSIPFATHDVADITAIAARAITDPRTINKAVQIYGNIVTQDEVVEMIRTCWPDHTFEYEHISSEEIIYQKDHADPNLVSAKGGAEPDRERWGINYTIWVLGRLCAPHHENTLIASDLYPDFVYKKPETVLCDRQFVFGDG